jgi:RNA polymerase sigma factor (sigma-70 family)
MLAASPQPVAEAHSLFERYREPVYRYCLNRLRSHEEAEDALQNTFLRAYAALMRGVQPDHEAAWLYTIAHNVCLSRRAAAARRSRVETVRDVTLLADTVAAPQREDDAMPFRDGLASLTPRLRRALLLREWQGLSYQEIADELGTTVSAVETLIFRARRQLAQALGDATRPQLAAAAA